jgi:glyoxylase-like metal-dependent hydrolase (beta-lactamase superfamily II)
MAREPAVRVGEGIWRLRLLGDWVNAYAVRSPDGQVTLVDTGVKSSAKRLSQALDHIGVAPQEVTRILISHVHSDHVGSVAEMVRRTGAPVEVHTDDTAALEAGRTPPVDQSFLLGRLLTRLGANPSTFEAVPAARSLVDREVVDDVLEVHHTPGHSPGHVSLLHRPSGTLVTGDALFNMRGRIGYSTRYFCTDFAMSQRSAQRLTELSFQQVAFMHGPHVGAGARQYVGGFLAAHPPTQD